MDRRIVEVAVDVDVNIIIYSYLSCILIIKTVTFIYYEHHNLYHTMFLYVTIFNEVKFYV